MTEKLNGELTILHLSDLHFGDFFSFKDAAQTFEDRWENVEEKLNTILNDRQADLLAITGDLGSKGVKDDYSTDTELFIKNNFKDYLTGNSFFIVPGNHDLQWPKDKKNIENSTRFNEFFDFLKRIDVIEKDFKCFESPHFVKEKIIKKKSNDFSSLILELNSCLYTAYRKCTNFGKHEDLAKSVFDENYKDDSQIHENKLLEYLREIKKNYEEENFPIRIALLHHNVSSYKEQGLSSKKGDPETIKPNVFIKTLRDYGFDIILHGHRHETITDSLHGVVIIGAGSTFVIENKVPIRNSNELNVIRISYDYIDELLSPNLRVDVDTLKLYFRDRVVKIETGDYEIVGHNRKDYEKMKKNINTHKLVVKKRPVKVFEEAAKILEHLLNLPLKSKTKRLKELENYYKTLFKEKEFAQPLFDNARKTINRLWRQRKYNAAKIDFFLKMKIYPTSHLALLENLKESDSLYRNLPKMLKNEEFSSINSHLNDIIGKYDIKVARPTVLEKSRVTKRVRVLAEPRTLLKTSPSRKSRESRISTIQRGVESPSTRLFPAMKRAPARSSYISKSPVRRIMRKEGAERISSKALVRLIHFLEISGATATRDAIKLAKADKRKRITSADIRNATRKSRKESTKIAKLRSFSKNFKKEGKNS